MDFDKIKKVAKDTFRIVSNKAGESTPPPRTHNVTEDDFDDFSMDNDFMGQTRKFDMKDALNRVKKNTDAIKNSVSDLFDNDTHEDNNSTTSDNSVINEEILSLRESVENIESHIAIIERKLTDISNSVSGVNKINDSIFDLKNSQINSRNSISELELSFRQLKKKIVSGITVISIITALIAILQIINLLS